MRPFRRWGRALAGAGVAALFIALLARRMDWMEVRQVLAGARWAPLALGLFALAGDMGARAARWCWMLRAAQPDLPLASCLRPFLGSLALNNTMPLRAGDVVRVFGFRRTLRAPAARVVGTLMLERVLDLLVLLAILFVGMLGAPPGTFPRPFRVLAGLAGLLGLTGLLAITLLPGRITSLLQRLVARAVGSRSWAPQAFQGVAQMTSALALLRSPGRAARLLGLSLLAWLLEGALFASVAWSLHIQVSWPAPWLSLGAATLATLLPSSPGYVGTFDYFAMLGLTAYGTGRNAAAAFALLAHLMLWLPVTLAGLVALLLGRPAGVPATLRPDPLRADPA
ncbi:MAG: lysylphosphatidylglycerol synthase transmembrane domain-containing protein [Gemmatimonadales bacterium]